MKYSQIIGFTILLGLFGCKKNRVSNSEITNNQFSDFPYSHHLPVVTFNSDTVSFKVGEDERYPLSDSVDFSKAIDVKMYYPIKEYFVNGINVFKGERQMTLTFGLDTVFQKPYNREIDIVLFNEDLEVKSDTGYLTFDLNKILDLSSIDNLNWEATIYIADTGFVEYGKFYLKK